MTKLELMLQTYKLIDKAYNGMQWWLILTPHSLPPAYFVMHPASMHILIAGCDQHKFTCLRLQDGQARLFGILLTVNPCCPEGEIIPVDDLDDFVKSAQKRIKI